MIVGLPAVRELTLQLGAELGLDARIVEPKKFPDGETYIQSPVASVVVSTGYPNQNEMIVETLLALDAINEQGKKPWLVLPYFPYARQDKIYRIGEAFSAKTIARAFAPYVKGIISIDVHFHRKQGWFYKYGVKILNLSAAGLLINYMIAKHNLKWPKIISPDLGHAAVVKNFGGEGLKKRRKEYESVGDIVWRDVEILDGDIKGENIIILDDMISSGRTIEKALEVTGPAYVAATHGLFIGNAVSRMTKAGAKDIICTNSIQTDKSKVDLAPLIAKELRYLLVSQ